MKGLVWVSEWQTRVLQNGLVRSYMIVLIMTTVLLTGYTLLSQHGLYITLEISDISVYEAGIALLMVASAGFVMLTRSRLGAAATLAVSGCSVAIACTFCSAPD